MQSYLENRQMYVSVNGSCSDPIALEVGLPQCSMLGPKFYSDYTQPMGRLIRMLLLLFHLYADDSQIFKPVEHPRFLSEAVSCLSSGVERIASWMANNKLKLIVNKLNFSFYPARTIDQHFQSIAFLYVVTLWSEWIEPKT